MAKLKSHDIPLSLFLEIDSASTTYMYHMKSSVLRENGHVANYCLLLRDRYLCVNSKYLATTEIISKHTAYYVLKK